MKKIKRLLSVVLLMALCLTLCNFTVFAAENTTPVDNSDVTVNATDYDSVWVPAGVTSGVFQIKKTFSSNGRVTFKARSTNTSKTVRMCVSQYASEDMGEQMNLTGVMTVPTNETEVKPTRTIAGTGNFYVHYSFPNGNPDGTFLMCWIYP